MILAADVLEHLVAPEQLLQRLPEVLCPDGRIIVSLPNVAHVSVRLSLVLGRFDYTETGILDRTHLHLYTFQSARRLLEGAGLRIEQEFGGSDRFGWLVNARWRATGWMRGLAATGIIMVARPRT